MSKENQCPGSGIAPTTPLVSAPAPGVRDLRHGRAKCSVCPQTIALTKNGLISNHGNQYLNDYRPLSDCTGYWWAFPDRDPILMHAHKDLPCPIHRMLTKQGG